MNGDIRSKLARVQQKVKAGKDLYNDYGKYKYRSAESILEAVKPVLAEEGCSLILTDSIEMLGDRYYVKASAIFFSVGDQVAGDITSTAYAREALTKKGMDDSQITGTASSYARKYALNGLLLLDDAKDADTNEYKKETDNRPVEYATAAVKKVIADKAVELNINLPKLLAQYGADSIDHLTAEAGARIIQVIQKHEEKK